MTRLIVLVLLGIMMEFWAAGLPNTPALGQESSTSSQYETKRPGFLHRSGFDMENQYNTRYASKCVGEITRGYSVFKLGLPPAYIDTVMLVVTNCTDRKVSLKLYGPIDQGKYTIKLARKCKDAECLQPVFSANLGEVAVTSTNKVTKVQPIFNFDDIDYKYDYQFVMQRGNNDAYKGDYIWAY